MGAESQVILGAAGIFVLRILGVSIATVRMLITVQGRRFLSSFLGFFEALVFAVAIASVVNELGNAWNMMAYCLGFAVGTYVGMWLESKFITNFVTVNVVSAQKSHEIASVIREAGFGATEMWGQGAEGTVGAVRIVVQRRNVSRVIDRVNAVDSNAFITLDETRSVRHGWLPEGRSRI
jgi:uncharacterized protein YebE (UPF0316 family)